MKKIFFIFLFLLFFLFYTKISSFAQHHACNQSCTGAADIACSEQIGFYYYDEEGNLIPGYKQGSCISGLVCYSGADKRCRNPYCPDDTDCDCSNFSASGSKVGMPNNQDVEPFKSQTVYFDLSLATQQESSSQPYSFSDIIRDRAHYLSVNSLSGSNIGYTLCYDANDCHNTTPTPAPANNRVYLCSNKITNYASLWWHYTPLIANANNIEGPTTVFVDDEVNYSAYYEDYNATLTEPLMYAYKDTCLGTSLTKTSDGNDPGVHTFRWTPSATGNYVVYAAANSEQATCIGYSNCVGDPPQYSCPGQNASLNITVTNPLPWYKLKNASLNKVGNHNISVVQNINLFENGDSDDNTSRYVIIGTPGVLAATGNYTPGPSYNPIPASSRNWYISNYSSLNRLYFDNFYQYLVSRKLVKQINSLSQINSDGVYFITTNTLNLTTQPPDKNFILIVRNNDNNGYGDINISINNFNSSEKSVVFLAKDIKVASGVQYINGIFIANNTFSYESTNGLKIKGNLISKNSVVLQNRTDNTRPSLFVVFSPKMYLDLLPYLSIAKYDWQQTR